MAVFFVAVIPFPTISVVLCIIILVFSVGIVVVLNFVILGFNVFFSGQIKQI